MGRLILEGSPNQRVRAKARRPLKRIRPRKIKALKVVRPRRPIGSGPPHGEAHPDAKLRATQVVSIRAEFANDASLWGLARKYGVDRNVIRGIVTGKRWKSVR